MKILVIKLKSFLLCICLAVLALVPFPEVSFGQTKNILAFGDSLTEGCDVHFLGDSVCGWLGGYGYENNLRSLLVQNNRDYQVLNYGRGGETTAAGVNRLDDLLNNNPCNGEVEFILILEGTNDLFYHLNVNNIIFNLEVMIGKVLAKEKKPLLATVTPDPDHTYKEITLLNDEIRNLAARYGTQVTLVDQYNALAPSWGSYTTPRGCYGDLIHPNPSGFDAMGSTWYAGLEALFPNDVYLPWQMLLLKTP